MTGPSVISILGGLGFLTAAVAAYFRAWLRKDQAVIVLRVAAGAGLIFNVAYFGYAVGAHGVVETFRHNYESALLLATLLGLVGMGTHLSITLRGLDGFLFAFAALIDLGALTVAGEVGASPTYKYWFVSHGLAFALSATCFVAAGTAGIVYLVVHRVLRSKRALTWITSVPSLEALERFGRWMLGLGFPLLSYGILTGVCGVWHREDIAHGAWYLDPSFIVTLIVWCVYAFGVVALIFMPRIRGRRAAALASCGMGLVVLSLLVNEFVSPIHQ